MNPNASTERHAGSNTHKNPEYLIQVTLAKCFFLNVFFVKWVFFWEKPTKTSNIRDHIDFLMKASIYNPISIYSSNYRTSQTE
jgi:hypothetical protein